MLRNERHVLASRLSFDATLRLLSKQQGPGRLHRVEHRGWVTLRHSWMEVENTWRCHTQTKIIGMIELVLVSRSPK